MWKTVPGNSTLPFSAQQSILMRANALQKGHSYTLRCMLFTFHVLMQHIIPILCARHVGKGGVQYRLERKLEWAERHRTATPRTVVRDLEASCKGGT